MIDLDQQGPEELKELLLATTGHRRDERFFLEPRLHPAIELQQTYDRAPARQKARLKSALLAAVAEWRAKAHGFSNLRFLAHTAAALRVRGTAPHFERILRHHGLLHRRLDGAQEITGDVVAALSGFAPGDDIGALLERLFFAPGLRADLAGVLFQGLCRTKREELPRWLEHYLHIVADTGIQHFSNPIFLRLFIESLTPSALAASWTDLDSRLRDFLIENLGRLKSTENPDLYFSFDQSGPTLHVTIAGRKDRFELRSGSVEQRFQDLHKAYSVINLAN